MESRLPLVSVASESIEKFVIREGRVRDGGDAGAAGRFVRQANESAASVW